MSDHIPDTRGQKSQRKNRIDKFETFLMKSSQKFEYIRSANKNYNLPPKKDFRLVNPIDAGYHK